MITLDLIQNIDVSNCFRVKDRICKAQVFMNEMMYE